MDASRTPCANVRNPVFNASSGLENTTGNFAPLFIEIKRRTDNDTQYPSITKLRHMRLMIISCFKLSLHAVTFVSIGQQAAENYLSYAGARSLLHLSAFASFCAQALVAFSPILSQAHHRDSSNESSLLIILIIIEPAHSAGLL